jgi:hypothetical protein
VPKSTSLFTTAVPPISASAAKSKYFIIQSCLEESSLRGAEASFQLGPGGEDSGVGCGAIDDYPTER